MSLLHHLTPDHEGESCLTCRYHRDGHCHRHAPTPHVGPLQEGLTAQWPLIVASEPWCGEYVQAP